MPLNLLRSVPLPENRGEGGFDHADVHGPSSRLYVAHTANDAIDIIDCATDRYVDSVSGLSAVAGALVSEMRNLVFTSNRGENTVSTFRPGAEHGGHKIAVGVKPNGLAFDPVRGTLIAANVGDPAIPGSFTVSVVDVDRACRVREIPVPGRTRWTVYDPVREVFYVNIAAPAKIVVIDARQPDTVAREFDVPAAGPHGLDLDARTGRLYCACDAGVLFAIDTASGQVLAETPLSGTPDVIFLDPTSGCIYVAVGDPGVIDVIDAANMVRTQVVTTGRGAHTLALDRQRGKVYAFLPETHSAAVYAYTA